MYTPYEWQTGEVITAEKLNKLEQGVKDVLPTYTAPTLDDNGDLGKALVVGRNGLNWKSNLFIVPTHIDENDKIRFDIPIEDWIDPIAYNIDGRVLVASTNRKAYDFQLTQTDGGFTLNITEYFITGDADGDCLDYLSYDSPAPFTPVVDD